MTTEKKTESGSMLIPKWCPICAEIAALPTNVTYTRGEIERAIRLTFIKGMRNQVVTFCTPHKNYIDASK